MRTTGPFTIKQCNRVADAWSVVCGPGVRIPPLPFHSFHRYHHSTTMSPPLGGSLQLLSCSFFSCFSSRARRGSLPSSPDPEGGDSSTYRLPRIREFLLVPRRFSIWREFLRNQISIKITSGWPILRFVSTISLVRPLQSFSVDLEGKLTRVQKALVFFFFSFFWEILDRFENWSNFPIL